MGKRGELSKQTSHQRMQLSSMSMELMALLLALSSLLFIIFAPFLYAKAAAAAATSRSGLPPGPAKLPVVGNLHLLAGKLPHRSLWLLSKKHGPLMSLTLGRVPVLVVSSSEAASKILRTHDLTFCSRPHLVAFERYSYGGLDIAFASYGEPWRQARRLGMVEMFSAKRVQSFRAVREEEVAALVRTISSSAGPPVNLSEMLLCLFNNITSREVFGRRLSSEGGECVRSRHHDLVMEVVSLMGGFRVGDFYPSMEWLDALTGSRARLERSFRAMDAMLEEEIARHTDGRSGHDDFTRVLLRLQMESTLGPPLTKDHIKAILMDMFIAGTDTTASLLEWGMTELVRNPGVMKKAQDEVRGLVGDKGRVEESDLQQLHYLKLVIKEILRLHPPAPFLLPRECREDCEIDGYRIPTKTRVYVNVWAIGRDHRSWDDAEAFVPERFENSSLDYKGQSFELLPFGSGRRICPGMSLGLTASELGLANLLYSFNWELPDGMSKEDMDMEECFGVVVHRRSPLLLVATPFASSPLGKN